MTPTYLSGKNHNKALALKRDLYFEQMGIPFWSYWVCWTDFYGRRN